MKKIAFFAFNGQVGCFSHVLYYALDYEKNGYDVKIIIEGAATKLIGELNDGKNPFHKFYKEVKEKGLIDCVCFACAKKMGACEEAIKQGLKFNDDLYGHPSMLSYEKEGYQIVTI